MFALTDADFDETDLGDWPENDIFDGQDMRHRYQILQVVNERHTKLRQSAFPFVADMGKPLPIPA